MPDTPPAARTWRDFPHFYENPAIQDLAEAPRWTVSDSNKVPINLRKLIDESKIENAIEYSPATLVTLAELNDAIPNAANNTFYLSATSDRYMIVDIEPKCPPAIAERLLRLPALYAELSMSGKGYHLVMPMPKNFWDFPIAATKKALQEEHKWYEILVEHLVTFTRVPIPEDVRPRSAGSGDTVTDWEEFYASLASLAVESLKADFDFSDDKPEIPNEERIIQLILKQPYGKTLASFHGNDSSFEFGLFGHVYTRMAPILKASDIAQGHEFTDNERTWLIYEAVKLVLPWRPKHDEVRNGLPYLLSTATNLVAARVAARH